MALAIAFYPGRFLRQIRMARPCAENVESENHGMNFGQIKHTNMASSLHVKPVTTPRKICIEGQGEVDAISSCETGWCVLRRRAMLVDIRAVAKHSGGYGVQHQRRSNQRTAILGFRACSTYRDMRRTGRATISVAARL